MKTSVKLAAIVAAALAFLVLTAGPLDGQDSRSVRGVVTDSTGTAVNGAMVVALALPDSVLTKYSLTNGDGRFVLSGVPVGEYLLQVTMTGYELIRQPLVLADADVDAGTIRLSVAALEMDELVVSIEHVPFISRRDTLAYNAAAFTTRPNATVEELLARLPGIEIDDDGTIRAQGEEVQNILVDGREFFGNDPTIATRNLPADAVERVEVYDRESDMAEFTGIADGEEERTINLALREDARSGYFGQMNGGLGGGLEPTEVIESQPIGRARYVGRANLFRFTSSSQFSLLSSANNVNQAGFNFTGVGGGGRDAGLGGGRDGFTETLSLGTNVNHDFADDRWIRTSYFLTSLDNTDIQATQSQQLLGSSLAALQSSTSDQVTDNLSHRLNLNAQWEFSEGHDIRLRGNGSFSSSSSTRLSTSESETLAGILQNTGFSSRSNENDDIGGNARLTWRKRLSEGGSALIVEARADISEPDRFTELETSTGIADEDGELVFTDLLQEQTRDSRNLNLTQRLSFTQPLGSLAVMELFGERRSVDEDEAYTVYDLDSGSPVLNDRLTEGFERSYSYLEGGFRLSRNREAARVTLGLEVQGSNLEGTILDRDETIENSFTHVLPSATLRFQFGDSKTWSLNYRTRTREPSLTQLQPFEDNTNPTRLYEGNPDLIPSYTHSLNTDYRFFDQFSFVNVFAYARFAYTSNSIVNSRFIDDRAIQTIQPVNIDHSWSTSGGINYGQPIRRIGAQLNLEYGVNYSRGVELLNDQENRSQVLRNSVEISLENRNKEVFEIRAGTRFDFNDVEYTLNDELDQGYLDKTVFGTGMLRFGDGWTLRSTLNWRLYDDDVFGEADRNVAMLQGSISKTAMNNRVEIQLAGFDLLDQNKGVSYTNGASFISEQRSAALGRYLMLNVTYRLGALGGGGPGRGGRGFRGR